MIVRIKNLRTRVIIGINDWEKDHTQDIVINIAIEFNGLKAAQSDDINYTIDYKKIKIRILESLENTNFELLEKMAFFILNIIHEEEKVLWASVEVDKPLALRFADSVSVAVTSDELRKN